MSGPPRRCRSLFARSALLACLALVAAACNAACPTGESHVCRTAGDCRCGLDCTSDADCTGRDVCVPLSGGSSSRGVCADPVWALDNPPCVPLCRAGQSCVMWGTRPAACADPCTTPQSCASGCCVGLQGGGNVCAPDASLCRGTCNPPCSGTEFCLQIGSGAACTHACSSDADCGDSCCLSLSDGSGACSPGRTYCPAVSTPACTPLACIAVRTQLTAASAGGCGAAGRYDGTVANECEVDAVCRACWFDARTNGYTDCAVIGTVPSGETVPVGAARCVDTALPEPPVKVKCIAASEFRQSNDCLGAGAP